MLYCIIELRHTLQFIFERWFMCINNERVLQEEIDENYETKMER